MTWHVLQRYFEVYTLRDPIIMLRNTYLLTPWCRILFAKLIVTQFIKKYPAFFMEP